MKFIGVFLAVMAMAAAVPALSYAARSAPTYPLDYVGEMGSHKAIFEDTLVHLARRHNLGFVEMMSANPTLDPWIPGAGAKVILPSQHLLPDAPRQGIVINLPEMHLFFFPKDGSVPQVYSIGIGREGLKTPLGSTTVVRKAVGPIWRPTDRMRKEDPTLKAEYHPGPDNPMGTHAMYLGWPQYAIHGTNKPYGIGRRSSSGCIRMYPEGILELFDKIPVGTRVTVVDQPVKVGWIDDKMYVEVHPTQDQTIDVEKLADLPPYDMSAEDMRRIVEHAGDFSALIDWVKVEDAVKNRSGYPVVVLDKAVTPLPRDQRQAANDSAQQSEIIPVSGKSDGARPSTSLPAKADPLLQQATDLQVEEEPLRPRSLPEKPKTQAPAPAALSPAPVSTTQPEVKATSKPEKTFIEHGRPSNPRTVQGWNN